MLEASEIVDTSPQQIATIRLTIPVGEMAKAFGAACEELFGALAAQGIEAAGPLFAHHLRMPSSTFDFELGVPVNLRVIDAGRVRAGEKPAMTVVRTVYHGGYEGLPAAWGEFQRGIEAQGLKFTADFWETYLKGPASSGNTADWRTEFARPLRR